MAALMEPRSLGATGVQVSAIGFGCQEVGGGYGDIDEAEFARAVGHALDLGINLFDTAEAYGFGASEEALGRALAWTARRGDRVDEVRHRLPGPAQLPRRTRRARARVDRREPATPRHRPRRRVHGALARPRHPVRGDHGRARRARARGQGALRRALELHPRRREGLRGDPAGRRRAVRARPLRPADGTRPPAVVRGERRGLPRLRRARLRAPERCTPGRSPLPGRRLAVEDRQVGRDVAAVRAPLRPRPAVRERRRGRRPPRRRREDRTLGAAARAPVGDRDAGRRARRSSGAARWPRSTTTPRRSTGRSTQPIATPSSRSSSGTA